jgi:hypothetical protein
MKRISSKVNKMTEGDYVGMLTSSPKEKNSQESTTAGARTILSVYQTDNETAAASNETYWVNEPMMIDENIMGGILAMSVMLTIFVLAFLAINNITVAPHLTDAINPEGNTKKNQ